MHASGKITIILTMLLLLACQPGLYNTDFFVLNSTSDNLYIEWVEFSNTAITRESQLVPGAKLKLSSAEYGAPGTTEKLLRPPTKQYQNITIRVTDEDGEMIYMGVVDDDWNHEYYEDVDNDFWTLEMTSP